MYIIWLRVTNKVSKYREIVVQTPTGVSLEQVVNAQRAISQIQGLLQTLNIAILKIWALALSLKPEVSIMTISSLVWTEIACMLFCIVSHHVFLFVFSGNQPSFCYLLRCCSSVDIPFFESYDVRYSCNCIYIKV